MRSAAVAFHLKVYHQVDAVAVGLVYNSPAVIALLCEWAERIWVAEAEMVDALPEAARSKVMGEPIGPDVWGYSCNAQLMDFSASIANELAR